MKIKEKLSNTTLSRTSYAFHLRHNASAFIASCLVAGCLTFALPAAAKVTPLNRIAVIVDDGVIMESEVNQRLDEAKKRLASAKGPKPPADELLREVVEQLVLESIQIQMAERAGVRIEDNRLNEAMIRVAKQNSMNLGEFQKALEAQGMSYAHTREQIKRQMITTRLREGVMFSRIQITDQEIDNYLASDEGQSQMEAFYQLGHLLIGVDANANEGQRSTLKAKADDIYQQLQEGGDFAQLTKEYSTAPNADKAGDLGWRKHSKLPSLFKEIASTLEKGQVSTPIESASGYHIIQVIDKRGGDKVMMKQSKVRHILIKPTEIRDEKQSEALSRELYARIKAGEDFATLATEHSDDTGTLADGGSLGWLMAQDVVPAFRTTMENAELNQTSEPFRSQFGWHILEVTERKDENMGDIVKRNRARDAIFQRKFDEEVDIWLRKQREDAYVDIKLY